MNIISQIYTLRKRIKDKDLIKGQKIFTDEIARRLKAEEQGSVKGK